MRDGIDNGYYVSERPGCDVHIRGSADVRNASDGASGKMSGADSRRDEVLDVREQPKQLFGVHDQSAACGDLRPLGV